MGNTVNFTANKAVVGTQDSTHIGACKKAVTNLAAKYYKTSIMQVLERQRTALLNESFVKKHFKVAVTDHALGRWNTRVGKKMNTKVQLANFLQVLMNATVRRFQIIEAPTKHHKTGLIELDKEILASYVFENGEYVFVSFFGRKSKVIALNNWKSLRHFIHQSSGSRTKAIFQRDRVRLDFSEEEMNQELLPAIAHTQWHLQTKTTTYVVEKYFVTEQAEPVYLVLQQGHKQRDWFIINTATSCTRPLTKRLRDLLFNDGQAAFITKYLEETKAIEGVV